MSKNKRIEELEMELERLYKLLEIEQLQVQIERKKREQAELNQPSNPWKITWGDSTMYADLQGAKDLLARINDSYEGQHRA